MTAPICHVVVGPADHGVVRFGRELHVELARLTPDATLTWVPDVTALCGCSPAAPHVATHVQFTDRLFGADPEAAAAAFGVLSRAARTSGGALTATLHDLPQPSDGPFHRRRVEAYGSVLERCDRVVVSSDHELQLMRENGMRTTDVEVIPLPIAPPLRCPMARPGNRPATLGLFGFIYPGKGHAEVIAAAAGLPRDVEVHALGAPSPGHDDLVGELHCAAATQRRTFRVCGHIADTDVMPALQAVTVPIAAHRHVSASGSLNTWLSAGRRPLAPLTRYTAEIERRNPGSLNLFRDTKPGLAAAIRDALQRPASTWLDGDMVPRPSPAEAAAAYAGLFERMRR